MSLRKRGKYWYGDVQADIRGELVRYGKEDDEVPTQFQDVKCVCGSSTFKLRIDGDEGAAVRKCTSCGAEHSVCDTDDVVSSANLEPATCVCGKDAFEITVGVSLQEESKDVRWLYVGCRCPACGMLGNYGDWPSESGDFRSVLARA